MSKAIDEKILAALVAGGSINAAARELGMTPRRITDKLQDPGFKARYEKAKAEVLSQTVAEITNRLSRAVRTLAEIAEDTEAATSVRVSACDSLLRHGLRYLEAYEFERRLTALEEINRRETQ